MNQTQAAARTAPPAPANPPLRITPRTPTVREEPPTIPSAADSPTPFPHATSPKPQAEFHERLLLLYLDPTLTIADIAFNIDKSIDETLNLTEDPEFLAIVDRYAAGHERRAARLARCGLETAARTFARIAETCDKPETARKAAGAIVRMHEKETREKAGRSAPHPKSHSRSRAQSRVEESAEAEPSSHPSPDETAGRGRKALKPAQLLEDPLHAMQRTIGPVRCTVAES